MKKYLFLAVVGILAAPGLALGQGTPGSQQGGGQGNEQNFEQRKENILKHINQQLTRLQKSQKCVESANNEEALEACRPQRPPGPGPGPGQGPGQ